MSVLGRLRAFSQPVLPEQIPRLTESLGATTATATTLSVLISGVVTWSDYLRGNHTLSDALLLWVPVGLLGAAVLALLRHPRWGLRMEWLAAALVLLTQVEILLNGLLVPVLLRSALPFITVVPLLFTAILPWRPSFPIGLGASGLALTVLGCTVLGHLPLAVLELLFGLGTMMTLAAAVVAQMHRRSALTLERAEARSQMVAADRLAQLGRLSAALAHELKTPLAAAQNQLQILHDLIEELEESVGHPEVTDADLREILTEARASADGAQSSTHRVSRLVQSMRDQTRLTRPEGQTRFSVQQRIEASLLLLKERLRTARVTAEIVGDDAELIGPALQLDQIIVNVVRNAIDAIEETGQPGRIRLTIQQKREGVRLLIEDSGPGVPSELTETIFSQGFSTKTERDGLGLGLWLCRNLVVSGFSGTLELTRGSMGGAGFLCWLPSKEAA